METSCSDLLDSSLTAGLAPLRFRVYRGHGLRLVYPATWRLVGGKRSNEVILDGNFVKLLFRIAGTTNLSLEINKLRTAAARAGWTLHPQRHLSVVSGWSIRNGEVRYLHSLFSVRSGLLCEARVSSTSPSLDFVKLLLEALGHREC